MSNILYTLAKKSYSIVSILFVVSFSSVFILRYFVERIPLLITAVFFLIAGVYMGYLIAYYSIKYLKEENMKKNLPLN